MMNSQEGLASLSCSELLASTRRLVENSRCVEADLLLHLGEIDERKLYLECAFPFVDERGRRCSETGALEFDHVDGFARVHLHAAERIRLLCRAHNQHAAEKIYGRVFMERARSTRLD